MTSCSALKFFSEHAIGSFVHSLASSTKKYSFWAEDNLAIPPTATKRKEKSSSTDTFFVPWQCKEWLVFTIFFWTFHTTLDKFQMLVKKPFCPFTIPYPNMGAGKRGTMLQAFYPFPRVTTAIELNRAPSTSFVQDTLVRAVIGSLAYLSPRCRERFVFWRSHLSDGRALLITTAHVWHTPGSNSFHTCLSSSERSGCDTLCEAHSSTSLSRRQEKPQSTVKCATSHNFKVKSRLTTKLSAHKEV